MPNDVAYWMDQNTKFDPERVVLAKLDITITNENLEVSISDSYLYEGMKIEEFLLKLSNGTIGPPHNTYKLSEYREHELGVHINGSTYVVFVLNNSKDWQFREGKPAITSKIYRGGENFGSWHVSDGGIKLMDYRSGCKIACFLAYSRPGKGEPGAVQAFNLHVEVKSNSGRWVELHIDPDVPEVGGEEFPGLSNAKAWAAKAISNRVVYQL